MAALRLYSKGAMGDNSLVGGDLLIVTTGR